MSGRARTALEPDPAAAADPAEAGRRLGRPDVRDPAAVRDRGRRAHRAEAALELRQRPARHRRATSRSSCGSSATWTASIELRRRRGHAARPPPSGGASHPRGEQAGRRARRAAAARTWARRARGVRDVGAYRVVARPLFAESLDRSGNFNLDRAPIGRRWHSSSTPSRARACSAPSTACTSSSRWGSSAAPAWPSWPGLPWPAAPCARSPVSRGRRARWPARATPPQSLPRPEANDEVAELAATLEDMLRQLDAARGETEAALERQREFVADASHELRTPLTSILANLELLEEELDRSEGPRDREAAAEIAGSALRSSRRMRRLVGDLLLLARRCRRRPRPARRRRRAGAPARRPGRRGARRRGRGGAAALGPRRDAGPAPESEDLTVQGSPDDLHRLVLNLVENALIHTPPGTPVVVSARRTGEELVLEVADRGPGVPPAMRERVFERFARQAGDRGGGSGLGLAIVRAVAEAHGGSVSAGEAEGGGAVFSVRLPGRGSAPNGRRACSGRDRHRKRPKASPEHVKRVLARRPSPAFVIACIALFVSLGGVSAGVATGFIDGREILDRTIRTQDIRDNTIRGAGSAQQRDPRHRHPQRRHRRPRPGGWRGHRRRHERVTARPGARLCRARGRARRGLGARGHHGLRPARPGRRAGTWPAPRRAYDVDPLGYVHLRGAVERDSGPNSPLADAARRGAPGHRRPLHRLARGRRAAARGAHQRHGDQPPRPRPPGRTASRPLDGVCTFDGGEPSQDAEPR